MNETVKQNIPYSIKRKELVENHPLSLMIKFEAKDLLKYPVVRLFVEKKWKKVRFFQHKQFLFFYWFLYMLGNIRYFRNCFRQRPC